MSDFEAGQNSIIALIRQWATHQAKIGRHGTNRRYRYLAAKLDRERPVHVPMEPQGRAIPLNPVECEQFADHIRGQIERERPKPWWRKSY